MPRPLLPASTGSHPGHNNVTMSPSPRAATRDSAPSHASRADDGLPPPPEGGPVPPRGALMLRALRVGLLIALLQQTGVTIYYMTSKDTWLRDPLDRPLLFSPLLWCAIIGLFTWIVATLGRELRRRAAIGASLIILLCATGAVLLQLLRWWADYQETSVSIPLRLVHAAAAMALASMLVTDLLLQHLRTANPQWSHDHNDLSKLGRLRRRIEPGESSRPGNRKPTHYTTLRLAARTRLSMAATALAAILAITAAAALPHLWARPTTELSATPPSPLPERPATIGTRIAWDQEIPDVVDITTTAAGLAILTTSGITTINPADGTTLWSYQRPAHYGEPVVSPDGRHLAVRIDGPRGVDIGARRNSAISVTVVLDAITGRTVLERVSTTGVGAPLQLSDSAILDDGTALSLADGSQRWRLDPESGTSEDDHDCGYHGPAGHASFILDCDEDDNEGTEEGGEQWEERAGLSLVPDTDPTAVSRAHGILIDPFRAGITVVGGWTAQDTGRASGETSASARREAQAVSLDALAGVQDQADTRAVPLGATAGLNSVASKASGTLVTYPLYDDVTNEDIIMQDPRLPRAQTIFDPSRRTAVAASEDTGLGSARLGVVLSNDEGSLSGQIILESQSGTAQATIPLTQGGTYLSPTNLAFRSKGANQLQRLIGEDPGLRALSAPGATIIALDTAPTIDQGSYAGEAAPRTYRLVGLTGGEQ